MTAPLVTEAGSRFGVLLERPNGSIADSFERRDGGLGSEWTDGADWGPTIYEPLGIHDGWVVCRDPLNRGRHGVTYAANQFVTPPPTGQAYLGIGCAWRETGRTAVRVALRWAGLWSDTAGHHCEAAPLLHVTPGTVEHGIGVWTSELPIFGTNVPFLYVAALGNPPEVFDQYIYAGATYTHTDGQEHEIALTTTGTQVSVELDGVPKLLNLTGGGQSYQVPVPTNLLGSTLHGFAVDTHFVSSPYADPATATATLPIIGHCDIRPT